jgi:hypothetical protein
MYIEATTGKDSFRKHGASQRRNTSVETFVRVRDDGEGRQIVPMFAAYQKKLEGFRDSQLTATLPATANYEPNIAGQWFRQRYEVLPGTEILIVHRRAETTGFSERTEYLLLIADDTAPLWRIRLDLPHHHLSAVPCVFFEGRFTIVSEDQQLPEHAPQIWRDYMGLEAEYDVADLLDPNQDEKFFVAMQLEGALKSNKRATIVEDAEGNKRVKIRRVRRIKTR